MLDLILPLFIGIIWLGLKPMGRLAPLKIKG